jgi:hypothetical protein
MVTILGWFQWRAVAPAREDVAAGPSGRGSARPDRAVPPALEPDRALPPATGASGR